MRSIMGNSWGCGRRERQWGSPLSLPHPTLMRSHRGDIMGINIISPPPHLHEICWGSHEGGVGGGDNGNTHCLPSNSCSRDMLRVG